MRTPSQRFRSAPDIWPGFVDALAGLLIIIIFLLMVFTLAHSFLNQLLSGRDEALERLNRQVSELAEMLAFERSTAEELRRDLSQLSGELQSSISIRDRLSSQLAELMPERDALESMLAQINDERDIFKAEAGKVGRELEDAFKVIEADREKIKVQLKELKSLKRDVAALREVRKRLEAHVGDLAATLEKSESETTALRDRSKELQARLATEVERTSLAQEAIEEKDIRLFDLLRSAQRRASELEAERKLSSTARDRLALLNRQLAALRQQLARIATALEASEAEMREKNIQIVNLGKRLNLALVSKVEELARYRSEFFGRLREVLGDRKDIRIEGDRFVFQSEVLFASGSAELAPDGQRQIDGLARTLKELARRIPKDLDWVLRVDGHTDKIPILTPQFPSNWELSTARAISVVKHLITGGIPPDRLAATGFGEFKPLDNRADEIAFRRNRRIELKLTQR